VGMSKSLGLGDYEHVSIVGSRTRDGNWGFELDNRRAVLAKQHLRVSGLEPALERAQSYLSSELGLTAAPAALQPLR